MNEKRIREFLKEKDIQHWLWDIDGMARVMVWVSGELGIDSDAVLRILMNIAGEMHKSEDSEILKTKPESVKKIEAMINDMENNPHSKYRQVYECGCKSIKNR